VMNSDQGSVFGSEEYVSLLASEHVVQSMNGRARWADNVLMRDGSGRSRASASGTRSTRRQRSSRT
jgi:hypothetical protein